MSILSFPRSILSFLRRSPESSKPASDVTDDVFSKPGTSKDAQTSPFLDARNAFVALSGANVASAHMWQAIALVSLLIGIGATAFAFYQSQRSTMVPYVVALDRLGTPLAVGAAQWAGNVPQEALQSALAAWVADTRLVTPDAFLQRKAIYNVYAYIGPKDPGLKRINEFYGRGGEGADPFGRAARESVEVEISTALPLTTDTWQIDWTETVRDRQAGRGPTSYRMRATLQVYVAPHGRNTTEEQMRRNPFGIYIKDFSWAKQLEPLPARR